MKKAIGAIILLLVVVFAVFTSKGAKPVSEWEDVFDMDCVCGNHLHAEPCDLKHYQFICIKCEKVYEKDWDVTRYE